MTFKLDAARIVIGSCRESSFRIHNNCSSTEKVHVIKAFANKGQLLQNMQLILVTAATHSAHKFPLSSQVVTWIVSPQSYRSAKQKEYSWERFTEGQVQCKVWNSFYIRNNQTRWDVSA